MRSRRLVSPLPLVLSRRVIAVLLVFLACTAVTSCNLAARLLVYAAAEECSSRVDVANAQGDVRSASGTTLGGAGSRVQWDPDKPLQGMLQVSVMTAYGSPPSPLAGHVTGAQLVAGSGEVLWDIPHATTPPSGDIVFAEHMEFDSEAQYHMVRDALLTGEARLLIDSDAPGLEHVSALLHFAGAVPPYEGRCLP